MQGSCNPTFEIKDPLRSLSLCSLYLRSLYQGMTSVNAEIDNKSNGL